MITTMKHPREKNTLWPTIMHELISMYSNYRENVSKYCMITMEKCVTAVFSNENPSCRTRSLQSLSLYKPSGQCSFTLLIFTALQLAVDLMNKILTNMPHFVFRGRQESQLTSMHANITALAAWLASQHALLPQQGLCAWENKPHCDY